MSRTPQAAPSAGPVAQERKGSRPKRESLEEKRERAKRIVAGLAVAYPEATCALEHETPLELLVSTILSAQCTDERVNLVTPHLWKHYPTVEALAKANPSEVEEIVKSTGFFRNKTKSILGAARKIVADHGGKVPDTMEELLALPGVARKTANVVLGTAFRKAVGVVVDTHVTRLSSRLGLSKAPTPEKIEKDLMKILPDEEWIDFSHRLIWHGRRVCQARNPKCEVCNLAADCPSAFRVKVKAVRRGGSPVRRKRSPVQRRSAGRRAAKKPR